MYKWRNLLLVIGLLFGTNTYSQNNPIACQDDAAGGLKWEGGNWKTTGFITRRFILVLQGKTLTPSSAAKVLEMLEKNVTCRVIMGGQTSCLDDYGGNILFDTGTMKGAISQIFGGTNAGNNRDTISVRAFTCQPF